MDKRLKKQWGLATLTERAAGLDGLSFNLAGVPITRISSACIVVVYCPQCFQHVSTAVRRKTGRVDYTQPKSFRLMALPCTSGKASGCQSNELMSPRSSSFPAMHAGVRKLTLPKNAAYMLMGPTYATEVMIKDLATEIKNVSL